jgi:hypothetical protein
MSSGGLRGLAALRPGWPARRAAGLVDQAGMRRDARRFRRRSYEGSTVRLGRDLLRLRASTARGMARIAPYKSAYNAAKRWARAAVTGLMQP